MDPIRPQPAPPPPNIENYLALQANDAISKGADPKAVTDRLGQYVQHLRANPDVASQANAALAKGADPGAVAKRLASFVSPPDNPGVLSRAGSMIAASVPRSFSQLGDELGSMIAAPIKSAFTAVVAPGVGEARPDARLSKGGNSSGRPIDTTPYDAEHGGVTQGERTAAGVQTLINAALPSVARLPAGIVRGAGTIASGAAAGAAYNPNDPAAGALVGATIAPALGIVGSGVRSGISGTLDVVGRPAETTPIAIKGVRLGTIQSAADRAAAMNAKVINGSPSTNGMDATSTKPVAPLDVLGTAGLRATRGLRVASPAAESIITGALKGRADDAVNRVIQHGLETTGLATRDNGVQLIDDMIAQRAEHGNANFQPVFAKYDQPLTNPTFSEVAQTPAGQEALRRGMKIAANEGETMAKMPGTSSPSEFDPNTLNAQQRGMYDKLLPINGGQVAPTLAALKALGETLPETESAEPQIAPTLKQAHYIKLGFDDMLAGAPEPGSGGTGPNYARSVAKLRSRWLDAMDAEAPEYANARQQYADESTLIRAGQLGQNLFKMHPDVAAKEIAELPSDAQEVARRTGFDALAERIENGPADVERGVGKSRDQKRMRLLFPDDASFQRFKQGLADEAQMHANEQAVLGGSNTADKLADMASMAGVTLPDVVRAAATGRWHRLVGQAAANATRSMLRTSSDALSAERARQLVAGANGDTFARNSALSRINNAGAAASGSDGFENTIGQALFDYYAKRGRYLPLTATASSRPSR